jgi:hypothetical protein
MNLAGGYTATRLNACGSWRRKSKKSIPGGGKVGEKEENMLTSISMDNLADVWLSNCGFDFCCGDDEEVEKEEKSIREKLEKLFAGHEKVTAINILSVDSAELLVPEDQLYLALMGRLIPINVLYEFSCVIKKMSLERDRELNREHAAYWEVLDEKDSWLNKFRAGLSTDKIVSLVAREAADIATENVQEDKDKIWCAAQDDALIALKKLLVGFLSVYKILSAPIPSKKIAGYIGDYETGLPSCINREMLLKMLGGTISPDKELVFIPGADLPDRLYLLQHKWQPVAQVPDWAK